VIHLAMPDMWFAIFYHATGVSGLPNAVFFG